MMIASCYRGALCTFAFTVLLVCGFGAFFVVVVVFFWGGFVLFLGGVECKGLCKGLRKVGRRRSL